MLTIFITNLYYEYLKNSQKPLYFEHWRQKKKIHWDGLIMINYVLNLRLIPVQKEQLFAFRDFPHKYLWRKISNWTLILSHSSHQLLKGRKCFKTEGFFSHFAKLWAFSCSPAHAHIFRAEKQHFLLLLCFPFSALLKIRLFNVWLSPLRLSLLCSFLILSSGGKKIKQVRVSHFHLSSVLPVGKKKPKDSQCALEDIN